MRNMDLSESELRNANQFQCPDLLKKRVAFGMILIFARIEELIRMNSFSREEITHLMEILNSRVDNAWEKRTSNDGGDTQTVSRSPGIPRTPFEGQQDIGRTTDGASREASDVPVGVSASPIDIARAFMASRNSRGGQDLHIMSNSERAQPSYEFARKPPLMPTASPKPSICWPGAVVQDHHGYATPQGQRGRHRLHDFPRTPYSRTLLSKSTTKLQADSGPADTSSLFRQSPTSIYGQVKPRGESFDAYGSVGPIRRVRNKFSSEVRPRGSIFQFSPKEVPSKMGTPQVSEGFLPSAENKFEPGETSGVSSSSDRGVSNPNISHSQAVRKILEHLDQNKPTPKEKEAELKLATGWRSSEATGVSNLENTSSMHVEGPASYKNTDTAGPNLPILFNRSSSKSSTLENFNDKGKDEAQDIANGSANASSSVFTVSKSGPGAGTPLFGLKGTSGPVLKSQSDSVFAMTNQGHTKTSSLFSSPHLGNGQEGKMVAGTAEGSKNHGNKRSLPSILINKPGLHAASSDNGPGFTFPVSASSGVNSEPPTPSIMPSSSASIHSQLNDMPSVPLYTFGTKKSAPSLVFSFPSSSSDSNQDAPDLKFSFGSEKKTRLSFSSFEKDAICY